MTTDTKTRRLSGSLRGLLVIVLAVAFHGCGTDSVSIPGLTGPAGLGLNYKLTIKPDVLVADGFSTAAVRVTANGPDGHPLGGRGFTFLITDSTGVAAGIGTLSSTSATTNGDGIAQVIYTAPARTDATANQQIRIAGRPIGTDANSYPVVQSVTLDLRSAEPRLFPPNPNNKPPLCGFVTEPAAGSFAGHQILFQTTSSDPDGQIVRYQWDFGDGTDESNDPDVNHVFALLGNYTVTHIVTDNNGAVVPCSKQVTVNQ